MCATKVIWTKDNRNN